MNTYRVRHYDGKDVVIDKKDVLQLADQLRKGESLASVIEGRPELHLLNFTEAMHLVSTESPRPTEAYSWE